MVIDLHHLVNWVIADLERWRDRGKTAGTCAFAHDGRDLQDSVNNHLTWRIATILEASGV